jgi:AcrR family transcriptional regulator
VSQPSSTVDRLLATAGQLFYERGVTATGVDAVVKAAGLSKPTLYAHFPSKSALLAAALTRRHDQRRVELQTWVDRIPNAAERPLAVFGWLSDWYARDGARGCGFLNAAAELPDADDPARQVIQAEKRWLQDFLTDLCRTAGLIHPELLGSQLLLLVDGIGGRAVVDGARSAHAAVADATRVAELLTTAATPGTP